MSVVHVSVGLSVRPLVLGWRLRAFTNRAGGGRVGETEDEVDEFAEVSSCCGDIIPSPETVFWVGVAWSPSCSDSGGGKSSVSLAGCDVDCFSSTDSIVLLPKCERDRIKVLV